MRPWEPLHFYQTPPAPLLPCRTIFNCHRVWTRRTAGCYGDALWSDAEFFTRADDATIGTRPRGLRRGAP